MRSNQRRRKYLGTAFQNKILIMVLAAAIIPATIIAVCMYYLIFNMLALQMVFPETIAHNLIPVLGKVNLLIAIAVPIILVVIWIVALEVSHQAAGPIYRIDKELDERIAGTKHGPIKLRPNDEFKLLVEKINKLICK